jgi:triphosphoribosyl-dephospho-CoA synthase
MPLQNKTRFSISKLQDILRCINLASLLEVSGWPKPGNVHRTKGFVDTRFEHFLASIAAIQPNFQEFCRRIAEEYKNQDQNFKFIRLGKFFLQASKAMMKWQEGGNVLLGHILILAPLAAAITISFKQRSLNMENFKENLKRVLEEATVEDTVDLYEAIKICNPGGLGKIDKYDITDKNSINELRNDNIALQKIFKLSESYDSISFEYANGFQIILDLGLPYFLEKFEETQDINITTVDSFLKILAKIPDTLISRKLGEKEALIVSEKAARALNKGGISTEEGLKSVKKMDLFMHKYQGKMNPGTTADLLAGVIFVALLLGIRF